MTREQLREVEKNLIKIGLENVQNIILVKNGATNGDVIKVLFPNEYDFETDFDEDWWNSLYKGDKKWIKST